eukprot:438539-Pleurochrysis_carterae.AAC.1
MFSAEGFLAPPRGFFLPSRLPAFPRNLRPPTRTFDPFGLANMSFLVVRCNAPHYLPALSLWLISFPCYAGYAPFTHSESALLACI